MPGRKSTVRVNGGPQGKDAYVVLKVQTVGESQEIAERINNASDEERGEIGIEIIQESVVETNWLDDNNRPIMNDENWVKKLTTEEMQFISESLRDIGTHGKKRF